MQRSCQTPFAHPLQKHCCLCHSLIAVRETWIIEQYSKQRSQDPTNLQFEVILDWQLIGCKSHKEQHQRLHCIIKTFFFFCRCFQCRLYLCSNAVHCIMEVSICNSLCRAASLSHQVDDTVPHHPPVLISSLLLGSATCLHSCCSFTHQFHSIYKRQFSCACLPGVALAESFMSL